MYSVFLSNAVYTPLSSGNGTIVGEQHSRPSV